MYSRISSIEPACPSRDAHHAGQDLAGGAVAALSRVVVDEGLLQRMQLAVRALQALDGGHAPTVGLRGHRETRHHASSVHVNRAGAALPLVAALLHARQAEVLAQDVESDVRVSTSTRRRQPLTRMAILTVRSPADRAASAVLAPAAGAAAAPGMLSAAMSPPDCPSISRRVRAPVSCSSVTPPSLRPIGSI